VAFTKAQQLLNDKIDITPGSATNNVNAVIYLPANYSTTQNYPLVIYNHSISEATKDINDLYSTGLPQVLKGGYKPSFDFIMVAPQRSSYSVDPNWLQGVLEDAQKRWSIDTGRIYLTGQSSGGWPVYGAQLNISPDFARKFAAIVINSGATQDAKKTNFDWWTASKTPLWAIVGESDPSFIAQNSYMVDQINKRVPGLATLTIRPGVAHGGWNDVYNGTVKIDGKDMWQWLYQFSRSAAPAPSASSESTPSFSPSPSTAVAVPTTPAYRSWTLTTKNGQLYLPNGLNLPNLQPGDTVYIPAGTYKVIDLGNFQGTAERPIIIRNKGGQVVVNGQFRFSNKPEHFRLLGNGTPGITYGFKVDGQLSSTSVTSSGVSCFGTDFEMAYIEVLNSQSGFFIKKNPLATDPITQFPNYIMKGIKLHHNYIHDIKGEAMYIGHTGADGGQDNNPLIPVRMENVEIAYNIIDRIGWDGIQLSNATTGNSIHDNIVTNFGTTNMSSQQAGILLGANSQADIYNNTIKNGTGNGIQVFGFGVNNVYNNYIESVGQNGTAKGLEAIFSNDMVVKSESRPKQQVNIYNNTILYPQPWAAVRLGYYNKNSEPAKIQNNKILLPNAPANWIKQYLTTNIPNSIISGNSLIN
jgi:dienelactone hydrolase